MPGPTLTVEELADELGRKRTWIYDNFEDLCRHHGLPRPLLGGRAPLTWDRAQVMAWKDKKLPKELQASAAAFRAAFAAAEGERLTHSGNARVSADRAALDDRFPGV